MNRVLVFGTYDVIHPGHIHFFKESKKFGDKLIVVVARDTTVEKVKGKLPLHDEQERLRQVSSLDVVDKAVLGKEGDKYAIIEEIRPAVICIGYDQDSFTNNLQEELLNRNLKTKIVKFSKGLNPDIFKSSKIKKGFDL